ncbi:thiamine pyrophosphate-binding protein [Herbiconiux sp. CPCC 203407]|uniref:Thiamine pyrophosphate-binding protein n=1 Tax=Herbiconiux oxytropis TaxID=2970915 RepID=A0AA41XED0_9MICO|nr:thiamine pyrophosphate-binding protein [Herbiconiux oxytropis]MCS5721742.1 thiamine pyrophosphate-binding protein [Herbiconiux oxytropis]MCS5726631.1 thiamine pyrophosphate-binding protein [Herbiconiux oxytropis]
MNVAELVGTALGRLGVGHVFTVVGSGNFEVTNALAAAGVPVTTARHEGGAATMADAFSRMSDLPAVLTTHQGCGLTNAATGIGEAAKSRTPMIVLTADVANGSVTSNFKIDQDALARSLGAVAERVHSAGTALADVVRAYRTAVNERRTVVISLPLDVQAAAAPALPDDLSVLADTPIRPSAAAVEELAAAIRAASRPVFVAGRGARGAGPELVALAEASGALLATSAVANGLFQGQPFALGISGGFSSPRTAELISSADLVVGWGCALNMWTMRHGNLIGPDATVVQVDVEGRALGANRPIDLGVVGDSALTAVDVLAALEASPREGAGYRSAPLEGSVRWNDEETPDVSTATAIDPRELSKELDRLLPAERIVSIDSGNFMGYPSAYLAVPDERGFCFTQAFQSIGLGLATAIGAALAQPSRLPVLGTGDGGFLMAIAELETAVRIGLPLVVVVYNDAAYGAEVHHFGEGTDLSTVTFPETDIASIARGYGAAALTVRSPADLAGVTDWLASSPTAPLVIDAKIASDGGSWWLHEAFKGH